MMTEACLSEDLTISTTSVYSDITDYHRGIHNYDRPLPVVELKPFVREVWRRENSLPEYYDKINDDEGGDTAKKGHFEAEKTLFNFNKEKSDISAALVCKYLDKDAPRKYLDSGLVMTKYKIRIHPSIDFSYNYRIKRPKALIPEFIPRVQRSRHTLKDALQEDNENREYSCSKQHLSERMEMKQQEMKLLGARPHNMNVMFKTPLDYLNPTAQYGHPRVWFDNNRRNYHTRSLSPVKVVKTPSIDGSCKSYGQNKSIAGLGSMSPFSNNDSKERTAGKGMDKINVQKQKVSVAIGSVKNALQILSKMGPPTIVERQLTFEMKLNMEKYRRHVGMTVSDGLPTVQQLNTSNMFYDVNRSALLTRGETMIKHGQQLNRVGLKSGQELIRAGLKSGQELNRAGLKNCQVSRTGLKSRKYSQNKQTISVDFDRNMRPVSDNLSTSNLSSPRMDILDSVLCNGGLNQKLKSPRSPLQMNEHHVRDTTASKPTPTSSCSFSNGNNVKRVTENDMRLEEVNDKPWLRSVSSTSGASPPLGMYITEACGGVRMRSLDSCMLVERMTVETQTEQIRESHFKCNSVKLKDVAVNNHATLEGL